MSIYLLTSAGPPQPNIEGMRVLYEPDQGRGRILGP